MNAIAVVTVETLRGMITTVDVLTKSGTLDAGRGALLTEAILDAIEEVERDACLTPRTPVR